MSFSNSKPTIAIDIDDVLADNAKEFIEFSNRRWGTSLMAEDYDEHWGKLWQVDHEEVERRANEYDDSGVLSTYNYIHFSGIWDDINDYSHSLTKGEISRELGVDFIIDDQLKHCLGAATLGIQAILFGNYTWNQTDRLPKNVERIDNWLGGYEVFR
jgi:uncharacterized HAD superfamily protein